VRSPTHSFVLEGPRAPIRSLLRDLWSSRDLIIMLARKDYFVRYRRASLGLVWAVGLPFVQALVLSFVFSKVFRFETDVHYGVFVFSGILPWSLFAGSLGAASTSIVDNHMLASKIYFPRAVFPMVTVLTALFAVVPGVIVLLTMALVLGVSLDWTVVLIVPGLLLMVLLLVAFNLVTSALHVYFRDIRFVVAAALTAWMYATPVLYPLERAPGSLRTIIELNPVTGAVTMFRAPIGGTENLFPAVWWTLAWIAVLGTIGVIFQARRDRVFIDLL